MASAFLHAHGEISGVDLGLSVDVRIGDAYWVVTHEDTRGLGRIRAVAEHLAMAVTRNRAMFL